MLELPKNYSINVEDYSARIAESLRHDGWPLKLSGPSARLIAARYGVDQGLFDSMDYHLLKDVSATIAGVIAKRVEVRAAG